MNRGSAGDLQWCIVEEASRPAEISEPVWNMALDAYNLDCVLLNGSRPRMRLYDWTGPAITLGKFQDVDRSLDRGACRSLGLEAARRPTGGRGILHGSDLTISLAIRLKQLRLRESARICDIYGSLSQTLIAAFSSVGLEAARGCCTKSEPGHSADCMATVSRADIVAAGSNEKILGAALLHKSGCILLQCTIPVNDAGGTKSILSGRVFRGASAGDNALPRIGSLPALRRAIIHAMAERFGASPETVGLNLEEIGSVMRRSVEHQVAI